MPQEARTFLSLRPLLPVPRGASRLADRGNHHTKPRSSRPVHSACENCRSRKAKCSGIQPCERCSTIGARCVYVGRYQNKLKDAIKDRDENANALENILRSLQSSDSPSIEAIRRLASDSTSVKDFVKRVAHPPADFQQNTSTWTSIPAHICSHSDGLDIEGVPLSPSISGLSASSGTGVNGEHDILKIGECSLVTQGQSYSDEDQEVKQNCSSSDCLHYLGSLLDDVLLTTRLPPFQSDPQVLKQPGLGLVKQTKVPPKSLRNSPGSSVSKAMSYPVHARDHQISSLDLPIHLHLPLFLKVDPRSSNPSQVFSHTQGKFVARGRELVLQFSPQTVLGPPTVSLAGLFEPLGLDLEDAVDVQTWSKIYMSQFDYTKPADKIAMAHLLVWFMRWLVYPCKQTYEDIPWWLRPTPAAIFTPHLSIYSTLPWAALRDYMIEQPSEMALTFATEMTVNWSCSAAEILAFDEEHSTPVISPMFLSHLLDLDNWSLSASVLDTHPELAGKAKFR